MNSLYLRRALVSLAFLVGGPLLSAQSHSVSLNWQAGGNTGTVQYNIYRFSGSCPSTPPATALAALTAGWQKLSASPVSATTDVDSAVAAGTTYCYFVTALTAAGESLPSNDAQGAVPGAFPPAMLTASPI